jgi:hypothetical protein
MNTQLDKTVTQWHHKRSQTFTAPQNLPRGLSAHDPGSDARHLNSAAAAHQSDNGICASETNFHTLESTGTVPQANI